MLGILAGAVATAVAVGLAATGWNRHLSRRIERRFPPAGGFVEVGGRRLHYLDRGAGAPLVLVHGANGSLGDWLPGMVERLEREFRVIAFDRPGHGYSDGLGRLPPTPAAQAALLADATAALGVERPILVGFSLGAALVAAWALARPRDVAACVMLAGALHDWPTPTARIYDLPALPLLGPLAVQCLSMSLGHLLAPRWTRGVFAPDPVPASFAAVPALLAARPKSFLANAAERRLIKRFLAEQSQRYPALEPPVVLLVGDSDQVVSPRIHSGQLHQAVPGSILTVLPGAGHMLPFSHPEACLAAIRQAAGLARARHRLEA